VTTSQYQTLTTMLHRLEAKVDAVEERLAYVYPTDREMCSQIDHELSTILAPGGGVRVFEDEG
jgi:hypothetical protein